MAYVKLPRVSCDYGLGYQTINQAFDNVLSSYGSLVDEHGTQESGFGFGAWGHHNTYKIPRAVLRASIDVDAGAIAFQIATSDVVAIPQRLSAGKYQIRITGLADFRAHVSVETSASAPMRLVHSRAIFSGTPESSLLYIETRELSSGTGAFEFFDCNFHAFIYGDL